MLIFGDSDPNRFQCRWSVAFHHLWPTSAQIIRSRWPADPAGGVRDSGKGEGIDFGDSERKMKARKGRKGEKIKALQYCKLDSRYVMRLKMRSST